MTPSTPTRLITMPTSTRPRRPPVLAVIPTLPAAIPKPRRVITSPTNAIVCSSSFPTPDTYRSACSHGFAFMNMAIDAASATTNTSNSTMLPSANSDHPKKTNAARNNTVANPCVEFAPINSLLTSIRLRCLSPGIPHPIQAVARFDVGTSCVTKSAPPCLPVHDLQSCLSKRHTRTASCVGKAEQPCFQVIREQRYRCKGEAVTTYELLAALTTNASSAATITFQKSVARAVIPYSFRMAGYRRQGAVRTAVLHRGSKLHVQD